MERKKEVRKSFLTGKKGAFIFCIALIGSVGLCFLVAQTVDLVIKKTEVKPPRSPLPFASHAVPSAENVQRNDPHDADSSLKLGFYNSLQRNETTTDRLVLRQKKAKVKTMPGNSILARKPSEKNNADNTEISKQSAPAGIYVLQVGAFQQIAKAEVVVNELRSAGYHSYTDTIVVPGKGTLIRVRIGPFREISEAQKKAEEIEKKTKIPVSISKK